MASKTQPKAKVIVLAALLAICAVLVYRDITSSGTQSAPDSVAAAGTAGKGAHSQREEILGEAGSPAIDKSGRREQTLDPQELAALDPTLRLDLLQKVNDVKYQGSSRNIFQYYVPPPPKPVAPPVVQTPVQPQKPAAPPPPTIPLKFYGTSSHPGSPEKKAFLTDGDEIFIGGEGEVIDKHYKIVRIGMSALDWEDTQTHQHGQLPLLQE